MPHITTIHSVATHLESLAIVDVIQASQKGALYGSSQPIETFSPYLILLEKAALESTAETLQALLPTAKILLFPPWDGLPYDGASPSLKCLADRLECLTFLLSKPQDHPLLILTCAEALLQKLPPQAVLSQYSQILETGGEFPVATLIKFFQKTGYERVETVMSPGTFAQRGGLIDCFPVGYDTPLRLDFFGDELESIKAFDPVTQRTLESLKQIILKPLNEVILDEAYQHSFRHHYRQLFGIAAQQDLLYENIRQGTAFQGMEHWLPLFYDHLDTLLDYLPSYSLIRVGSFSQAMEEFWAKVQENYKFRILEQQGYTGQVSYRVIEPTQLYIAPNHWEEKLQKVPQILLSPVGEMRGIQFPYMPLFPLGVSPLSFTQIIEKFIKNTKVPIYIYVATAGNLERIQKQWEGSLPQKHSIEFQKVPFPRSFRTEEKIVLVDADLLGFSTTQKATVKKKEIAQRLLEIADFQVGDYLVHQDHGIGRYEGLETLQIHGASHDCLCLIYHDQDKLFLPVENIDALSFYASKMAEVTLDRLGSTAWQMRKAKAKKRIKEIAEKLMSIAAQRKLVSAAEIHPLLGVYEEFCKGFPFVETPDQEKAVHDVIEDLAKPMPMDRLICGDVGFGKTEVALRAAFIVAQQGGQVAILAPTTLLARQHYEVFKKRFQPFPLSVALLSRFQSADQIKKIQQQLEEGAIQVVIGTHALLTPKVKFKNLELLTIDEEQHFGVKQKENLKDRYPHVHCLSLSATPIPRTLQMAVSGIRDLSLITTAPLERQPIISKVIPFDPLIVKEALIREKERGGQSFFVCPRVADIGRVLPVLHKLLPSFKIIEAHGQMPAKNLEDTIIKFCDRHFDVLVSTNIVESGLDIPSANTLLVYRSDLFGLSQLYQLRGRVGRSKAQGYAFFTVTPDKTFSVNSQRRLEVLQNITGLGGGFTIASHDMDIRGTGNLVGEEQSGQIKEVGLGLYQHMLEEAIQAIKLRTTTEQPISEDCWMDEWTPQINLGLEILIPEDYIADLNLRLGIYQRIGHLKTTEEVEEFRAELRDRFGPIPPETDNLLMTVSLRNLCRQLHIQKIEGGSKGILVSFHKDIFPWPDKLFSWIKHHGGTVKIRPDQKIVILKVWATLQQKIEGVYKVLSQLIPSAG